MEAFVLSPRSSQEQGASSLLQAAMQHAFSSPSLTLSSADSTHAAPVAGLCRKVAGHHGRGPGIAGAQARSLTPPLTGTFGSSLTYQALFSAVEYSSEQDRSPGEWTFEGGP
ncbi:unnamed protein product [Rangifer tarandus platyrhynchus]|uniref:Uncharacterized protein n=1 Tax=Rangifer tarandus platyrhynchus TaxID=3082113 RepID=A0AC59Y5Q1_RANTA